MKYYVGLDVSMKKTSVCIVDEHGKIVHETSMKTDPQIIADALQKTDFQIELVGFESGALSHYLQKGFKERALPSVCIDAKRMSALLSVKINKTDKNDARGIADALRTGMFTRVHDKPAEAIDRSAILTIRRCLVNQRTDIKNHIRGILKTYGIRLGSVGPGKFSEKVKLQIALHEDATVKYTVESMLSVFEIAHQKLQELDQKLIEISRKDEDVNLLMTAHGIGPITALTYKAEIFDPARFKNSKSVGAYLGMTPTQYSSGETNKQGRISKCGSKELRFLLTEAAIVILTRSKKWSKLKAWGLKLMRRKGIKKAALAVGRKLAVIMHKMLTERKEFVFGESPNKTI